MQRQSQKKAQIGDVEPTAARAVHVVPATGNVSVAGFAANARAYSKIQSAAEIGALVRAARRKMKLNQQAFADLAGVGRRFISELEGGKPTLEFDKVMQVSRAAGVNIFAEPHR